MTARRRPARASTIFRRPASAAPATRPLPGRRRRSRTSVSRRVLRAATTASRRPARTRATCSRRPVAKPATRWLPGSPRPRVDHTQVQGTCSSCHNNTTAAGKPATHIATTSECSMCHSTIAWKPATGFTHDGITGTCASCHNGVECDRQKLDAHPDEQQLRGLPHDDRLEAGGEGRPHAGHRHLLLLSQRHLATGQECRPHRQRQLLRQLPHVHGLEADQPGRPRARDRHLLQLPRRREGRRQALEPRPHDVRMRHHAIRRSPGPREGRPHQHHAVAGIATTVPVRPGHRPGT